MHCSKPLPCTHLFSVAVAVIVLVAGITAGAQTTSTAPETPAQARAAARAARLQEKRQAAAAAKTAASSATAPPTTTSGDSVAPPAKQTPAQARAAARAARLQQKPQTAANAVTPASSSTAMSPKTNSGNSAAPSSASSTRSPATQSGSSGAVGTGTLSWATRVYSSTGCVHNGNKAVCTFTFVNQGNAANLTAGGAGELSGIQLVDDAHVPHRWDSAYFMDKYGAQQRRLMVQQGDTGTYVVGFPDVNPKVSSAEFHLRDQVIGGISVGATESKPTSSTVSNAK